MDERTRRYVKYWEEISSLIKSVGALVLVFLEGKYYSPILLFQCSHFLIKNVINQSTNRPVCDGTVTINTDK